MSIAKTGSRHPNWRGGISFAPYSYEFNEALKRRIRRRDNYTCQECHQTEKQLDYRLPIHHIDYNKQNINDNNLISLCRGCHSQTNFKRENWIDYFKNKLGAMYESLTQA
jgi:nitrate/TMAO reductase-like tetraheme cytochrome c subunit